MYIVDYCSYFSEVRSSCNLHAESIKDNWSVKVSFAFL